MTQNSAFVLDDWTDERIDFAPVKKTFDDAAKLDGDLNFIERQQINPLIAKLVAGAQGTRLSATQADQSLREAMKMGAQLATLRATHAIPPADPDARAIYDAVNNRWAINRRLEALQVAVGSISSFVRSLSELQVSKVANFALIGGFPIVVATGVAEPLARLISQWENPAQVELSGALWLTCFGVIVLACFLPLWWWKSLKY